MNGNGRICAAPTKTIGSLIIQITIAPHILKQSTDSSTVTVKRLVILLQEQVLHRSRIIG
jgi:hypothetical protein